MSATIQDVRLNKVTVVQTIEKPVKINYSSDCSVDLDEITGNYLKPKSGGSPK